MHRFEEILIGSPVCDAESRASGCSPSAPRQWELPWEPRELNREPRLQTGPDLSKTMHSKERGAMPSHAARCCVLCRCAMPCFCAAMLCDALLH
eukprot:5962322-Pyramimonas_sp.AAC.1